MGVSDQSDKGIVLSDFLVFWSDLITDLIRNVWSDDPYLVEKIKDSKEPFLGHTNLCLMLEAINKFYINMKLAKTL